MLWLYPNAVHLDDTVFPEPKAFCPMRLLKSPQQLKRMSDEFELARSLVRRTAAGGGTARTRSENAPLSTRRPS